jgi:hypothetical protein
VPERDTTAPVLRAITIAPSRFAAAGAGNAIARRGGGRVSWRLSEPAVVGFTVQRARAGRRVGRRCLPATVARSRRATCTRWQTLAGGFAQRATAGTGALRFSGRLRGRALTAGPYRLNALATDDAGNDSRAIAVAFRIIRRR